MVRNLADSDDTYRVEREGAVYKIDRRAWACHDNEGTVIGFRKQIPFTLFWAATIHQVQGLELESVVIHSDYECTGGLLYTGLSRVKRPRDAQLLSFKDNHAVT